MADPVNILVVDDLAAQRLTIEAALAELGQNVVSVPSGRDALKFLLDRDAAVILLDVNMPEMDGFETAALIRHRPRSASIPIIFLTADTDELQAARGYALGAVDYLVCPFLPDVLRTKVKVFVELSRAQERVRREAEQRIALSRAQAARAAAEDQSRRLRLLAEASGIITRSLEGSPFVGELLQMFVPRLADVAALALRSPAGGMAETTWVGLEGQAPRAATPSTQPLPHDELATALARCAAAREPLTLPAPGGVGFTGVAVPLAVHGACYGSLGIAMTQSGRTYTPDDIELMGFVAWRAAVALDNLRLYAELQDRDRRKDEFLAMLSHELRNPLGAISTAIHLLEADGTDPDYARRAAQVIARQSMHLTRILDDLLEVSRVTSGRIALVLEPVSLRPIVERVVEALRVAGRLEQHRMTVGGDDAVVKADEARIEQIVSNLLTNAIKYTDAGGEVRVELVTEGEDAVLRVSDNGIGISTDLLPRIFDVFVQGRQSLDRGAGGLGLGLALVRRLTELQGGRVEAESAGPGCGSTFVVRLPRLTTALPPAPGVEVVPAGPVPPLRVLLVEDHTDAREMLRALLSMRGHEVHEAATGTAAIEVGHRMRPQLALVDLGLPGLDGYEVARLLRAEHGRSGFMLVALTGYGQAEDRRRALESGFDAHLVKPIQPHHLDRVLQRAGQAPETVGT